MPSLGNDLASKRKELNLSIEDVHQSTKIPVAILESIEDDSIFSTLDENKTYIRSYIRSYARAVKIDDSQIILALDQTEKGSYTGLFGQSKKSEDTDAPGKDTSGKAEEKGKKQSKNKPAGNASDTSSLPNESKQEEQGQPVSAPPKVSSVDWADMGRRFTPLQSKSRLGIGLALLVLAIAAAAFIIIYQNYYLKDRTSTEPAQQYSSANKIETPYADSLQLNFTSPVEDTVSQIGISRTALEALPDTLTLTIYAAYGVLEPVRVFSDVMDNLNPYWVEQGQAYKFEFVNSIHIRGQYSRMVLLFNGHPVRNFRQQFYNPETRMLEIDRSYFENDASWLQPPPDSLAIPAPPPTVIKERPTFY